MSNPKPAGPHSCGHAEYVWLSPCDTAKECLGLSATACAFLRALLVHPQADVDNGLLRFSINGSFASPMGNAFENINFVGGPLDGPAQPRPLLHARCRRHSRDEIQTRQSTIVKPVRLPHLPPAPLGLTPGFTATPPFKCTANFGHQPLAHDPPPGSSRWPTGSTSTPLASTA